MRAEARSALAVFAILATGAAPVLAQDAAERPYLDLPITQTVNRDGVIRYAVWVKVGDRTVQAMIDTGSTGLRILPSVLPRNVTGTATDIAFGAGLHMEGVAVKAPIQIGSLKGLAQIEVVDRIGCTKETPNCDVTNLGGDNYLIGGDGYASEGYSAILGIGFPFNGSDIENPLEVLGVKQWIVDLPRPYEIADGHLILEPQAALQSGFTMLAHHGSADADGCIQGGSLPEMKCGTLLFDTGSPAIDVSYEGVETVSRWDEGAAGTLSFISEASMFKFDFQAGKTANLIGVRVAPLPRNSLETFIVAGASPYFTYDILYDSQAHKVGLKARKPLPSPAGRGAADTALGQRGDP